MRKKPTGKAKVTEPNAAKTVIDAGPVAVQVDSGAVAVVVAPPARAGIDRRLFRLINGLPHSATSDRYVSVLSDLGEGLGWVAGGVALAILGGSKGRRAGVATALASLTATYVVQLRVKPLFRRVRPFVNREARVVGIRPADVCGCARKPASVKSAMMFRIEAGDRSGPSARTTTAPMRRTARSAAAAP